MLNLEMDKLSIWFKANKLSLNLEKTKFIVFKPRQKHSIRNIQISIDNQNIVKVKQTNFLGVILDENQNWKSEISHIANKVARICMRGSICKINFSSLMFFGVTLSVCVYLTAERSSFACWQTDKVLFLFSNVKPQKLQRGLVNSNITNSISLPKLQEFCNENATTWRPSLLQSRYSYIIKLLVERLN